MLSLENAQSAVATATGNMLKVLLKVEIIDGRSEKDRTQDVAVGRATRWYRTVEQPGKASNVALYSQLRRNIHS